MVATEDNYTIYPYLFIPEIFTELWNHQELFLNWWKSSDKEAKVPAFMEFPF